MEHPETSVPLASILFTEELRTRPQRAPDFQKENRALIALAHALADSPGNILQIMADAILDMLGCDSAGISLVTPDGKSFHWPAIAGAWRPYIGRGGPRNFGPSGDALDCNRTLLFKHVERRYPYFESLHPPVEEALLVPFYASGKAVGTVWAVSHDDRRLFDGEDKRQLETMALFASAAYQAAASLHASKQLAAIVESSDDAIVSKNLDGTITSWNKSAERLFGYTAEEAIGQNITLVIPPDRRDEEPRILQRLRNGERVDHFETIRMQKDGKLLNISLTISPIKDETGRVIGASKVARDITDRKRAEEARKNAEISAKLLHVQDAERRRIARELHDGVGQLIVGIAMNAAHVFNEKDKLSPVAARCISENIQLIDQAGSEIRTVSYLLHPPMLDEIGLVSALATYAEGFAERTNIKVALEIAPDLGRLPQDYELSLFRIAQECLTNIHRHSGSSNATLKLHRTPQEISLEVSDDGHGIGDQNLAKIDSGASVGVGFRGMQERVKLIGGKIVVHSNGQGTRVLVTLPINWEADQSLTARQ
jgi:PAS domain S-box-containing protein